MTFKEPIDNCFKCEFKESVPGNCHIRCNNPDYSLLGDQHGIDNGWFNYPGLFDPIWKSSVCKNFKLKKTPAQGIVQEPKVGKESI